MHVTSQTNGSHTVILRFTAINVFSCFHFRFCMVIIFHKQLSIVYRVVQ